MTSFYLNLALGVAGGLALYFIGSVLMSWLLTMSDPLAGELTEAFPWVAGMFPLMMLMSRLPRLD